MQVNTNSSFSTLVNATLLSVVIGCAKTPFYQAVPKTPEIPPIPEVERPKAAPVSGPVTTPVTAPAPVEIIPIQKLSLIIQKVDSSSWWKNCLSVSIGKQTKAIGCNKGEIAEGNEIAFDVPKYPECIKVVAKMEVFKRVNDDCSVIGSPCTFHYDQVPTWTRFSQGSAESFKVFDTNSIGKKDKLVNKIYNLVEAESKFKLFTSSGNNTWLRFHFEDQPMDKIDPNNLSEAERAQKGIDFNDYNFDIKAENVNIDVEGTSIKCK